MRVIICALFLVLSFSLRANNESKNPFENISIHTLKNGMKVYLSPNQKSKKVELKIIVHSGNWAENENNLGANHVLEHMLFQDGTIEGDKSYLEVIKEAGGDVNAYVSNEHTAYYGSIDAEKGEWLISIFKKMLFFRNLEQHELELSYGSVELEIGKPFFINKWLGFSPMDAFVNSYFPTKDFDEREFGVPEFPFSREDERILLRKLDLETVKSIYDDFYYPSNMVLFVSGKFSPALMLNYLNKTFSDVEDKDGKTLNLLVATKAGETFHEVYPVFEEGKARLSYGLKLFNITAKDFLVLDSYFGYVSHRLMIEFRNKRGETYTAHKWGWYNNKYGNFYVNFETPLDKYEANRNYLINLINNETHDGKFTSKSFSEAIDLYLKENFENVDNDAAVSMSLAQGMDYFMTEFNEVRDPYSLLKNMSEEEYKKILAERFSLGNPYIVENVPPVLFKYDFYVFMFLSVMGTLMIFKSILHNQDEIRNTVWMVKNTTSPGKVIEVAALFISSILLSYLIRRPVTSFVEGQLFYTTNVLLSTYLEMVLTISLTVAPFMLLLSRFPTRLIFTGKEYVIKSLVLREEKISVDDVVEANLIGPFKKYSLRYLINGRCSLYAAVFNLAFWRPSLEIKTTRGTSYILNIKGAKEYADMINREVGDHKVEVELNTVEQAA